MRRHQQRRRPRRGSGQCLGAEGGWRVSPSDRGAPSTNKSRKKQAAASCCSLSGADTQQEMARRRSPSRLSPTRCFVDAYSSEPEAAGGEGGLGRQNLAQMYRDEGSVLLPRKGKSKGCSSPHHSKPPAAAVAAASAYPRRLSAWQQQHLAPAGEGCATPCTTSCTTLYGGDFQGHHEPTSRSPVGRCTRVEELLRDDQWASPVPRPLEYATDFPTDASKPPSVCPSSFSFSQLDNKASPKLEKKELKRRDWQEPCDSSPSLADLVRSLTRQYEEDEPQAYLRHDHNAHHHLNYNSHRKSRKGEPQISLHDLTDKRYEDLIPERDKKIAALMLARHQEEEEMKDRQLQVSDAWEKMRRKEKKHKARIEKDRQYQLAESLDQWQRDQDQRKAKLRLEEQQLLAARERDMMLRDKKWKKITKEQECRRREKLENARLQAEYRKRCQEKQLWDKRLNERTAQEQNSHLHKEKMLQVLEKRLIKEMERKRRKIDLNEYKRTKHMHVKDQMDDRLKADELYKRLCIEQKLQRSQEILEQLLEERNRELKEKTFKEEEQGLIAKVRAKETEEEKRRRKEMLLQIAEMKIQQAREIMSKNIQDKAQHMREINCMKERNHHCRKQKLDYDEKCHLREMQEALRRKDQKSNQILRHKDTAIEESRRIAKASYDLRDKMRDLINHNSFDQMALDAHRNASLLRGL
ncbi:coiled-coil domain-containing protein 185 [Rhineura floridana]|uniref:coiled-coil domain-containing protein 185 n=1 Tax=Rhineura floridana TaxID=261503 RepID=UPI002AC84D8F|nr:coiled-coil domain-containing protein 185 [Rhineura floridana]